MSTTQNYKNNQPLEAKSVWEELFPHTYTCPTTQFFGSKAGLKSQ